MRSPVAYGETILSHWPEIPDQLNCYCRFVLNLRYISSALKTLIGNRELHAHEHAKSNKPESNYEAPLKNTTCAGLQTTATPQFVFTPSHKHCPRLHITVPLRMSGKVGTTPHQRPGDDILSPAFRFFGAPPRLVASLSPPPPVSRQYRAPRVITNPPLLSQLPLPKHRHVRLP